MNTFRPLLLLLPLLVIASCGPSKDPKNASFVVAQGKNFKVTRGELNKEKEARIKGMGIPADKLTPEQTAFFESKILDMLVTRKVVLEAATPFKSKDISKQADEQIAKIVNQFPSQEAFAQKLKENGLTTVSFKKEIEEELLVNNFLETKVDKNAIAVDPADIEKFYKEHADFWKVPELVTMRQITVKVPETATKEDVGAKKKIIDDARARVAKGEKFEAISNEISEDPFKNKGGEYPKFTKGQAPAEIEAVAFSQKPGALSPVFKSKAGFHFLEVIEHTQPRTQTLEEVGGKISSNLVGEKRVAAVNALIKELRDKANVKITLPEPKKVEEKSTEPVEGKAATPKAAEAPAAPAKK